MSLNIEPSRRMTKEEWLEIYGSPYLFNSGALYKEYDAIRETGHVPVCFCSESHEKGGTALIAAFPKDLGLFEERMVGTKKWYIVPIADLCIDTLLSEHDLDRFGLL